MHIPKHFNITDQDEIFSFIKKNAFGQLVSLVNGKLVATHLPILLSNDNKTLSAHVARINPQHIQLDGQQALVIFSGPHDYISPTWYESENGVPTWNYQTVHIYGRCSTFDDAKKLQDQVETLSDQYETNNPIPWNKTYKKTMLNAIIGIEIEIEEIECQFKLSQNKSARDQENVISELQQIGALELAEAMQRVKKR